MSVGGVHVTEFERAGGQTYVTLGYVRVGGEHNHNEEIWLDEAQARQLLRELQDALLRAARGEVLAS